MKRRVVIFSFISALCALSVFTAPPAVTAQSKYSIKEMTPEVQAALDNRRNRYEVLRSLKQQGVVGENNKGYVELLAADNAEAAAVVKEENADRQIIYTTIAQQNNLEDSLSTIEQVFAQVQRDKADAGDKIQAEDGKWATK